MKNKKMIMALAITLMAIGFASVSTVLYLNGQTFVAGNNNEFDVYFSKAVENGTENGSLIKDKTHLEFTANLSEVGDTYILNYTVTNGSKNYDATFKVNYTGETSEYLEITNNIDTVSPLKARETRDGRIIIQLIKGVLEEKQFTISYEIVGSAVERDTVGGDEIKNEGKSYLALAMTKDIPTTEEYNYYLGYTLNKHHVETINIVSSKEVPSNAALVGDVSEKQNGSIMMYSKDEDNDYMLELYIGQDGGVVANPDSSRLFDDFKYLTAINGLENLDTSNVTDMRMMFYNCNDLISLDLSTFDTSKVTNMRDMFAIENGYANPSSLKEIKGFANFDTSKVTDMNNMFGDCDSLMNLDLSHFNTSNVTDMSSMFRSCDSLTNLDLSHFNTSNVTNMSGMFTACDSLTNLDLSHFNTSNVTNMSYMFSSFKITDLDLSTFDTSNVTDMSFMFGNCKLINLDLSNFDTSNVTNMDCMFWACGSLTNLDISGFDMSNVTNMRQMFYQCYKLTTTVTIRGTNCTIYNNMFEGAATEDGAQITVNYTADASDLVDKMIETKSGSSKVVKGTQVA